MALTKEKKGEILDRLKKEIKESSIVLFVNFHGLTTALNRELRKLLKDINAKYLVAKKTLIKKSLEEAKIEGQTPGLEGELALVFSSKDQDVTASARILQQFGKDHEEIKMLGGIMKNVFLEKEAVFRLASLPSKEVLISQFINVINAPRKGLVVTLNGVMRDFVSVLGQIKK